MIRPENKTSREHRHTQDLYALMDEARTYTVRIVGGVMAPEEDFCDVCDVYRDDSDMMEKYSQEFIWIAPSSDSPFSREKMDEAEASSEEALRALSLACMEAEGLLGGILNRLDRLAVDSHGTVAWPVLDSTMKEVWERIGRLQAFGVDARPLAEIARHFEAWVCAERENPARWGRPAPPPSFAERVRGSVSRMWSRGR